MATNAKRSKKNTEKEDRSRKWTAEETRVFARVLADEENCFGVNLEKLALKKSSNNEVFSCVKTVLDEELKLLPPTKNGPLDTSVDKLRKRYANIKSSWRKIDDRIRSGSGLAPEDEPTWYTMVNDFLSESNAPIELNEASLDLSFSDDDDDDDHDETSTLGETQMLNTQDQEEDPDLLFSASPNTLKKVVVEPHKKRKQVRSNKQALSHLAASVERVAEAQVKSLKASAERDELYLKFRREENEKQRQHELKLAEIYANANARQGQSGSSNQQQVVPGYRENSQLQSMSTIDWNMFHQMMNNK